MGFFSDVFKGPKDVMSPYLRAATDELGKVQVPAIEAMKIKLAELVQQGVITPEQAQATLVENNAFDDVSVNAQARGAQMSALQELQDQIANGGLSDVARSRIQQTLDEVNNNQRGQDQAITQDAQRRGVAGSGLELAQRLMSQQNAANTAGRQGMDIAAMAEQAKMQALEQASRLGGQIETNDFSQQAQKAQAQNAIEQFNATNQQQVTMANIAARNAAQQANLAEKQRIADTNVRNENTNRERNSNLIQQNYENRLSKAQSVAGALGAQGQQAQNYANQQAKRSSDLFSGAVGTAATFGAGSFGGPAALGVQSIGGGNTTLTGAQRDKYRPIYAAHGATVPGEAPYPGDDTRNDIVPAMVSPGEKIIPRTEVNEYEQFMEEMPRSEAKPSADAVKLVLQALSGMGC